MPYAHCELMVSLLCISSLRDSGWQSGQRARRVLERFASAMKCSSSGETRVTSAQSLARLHTAKCKRRQEVPQEWSRRVPESQRGRNIWSLGSHGLCNLSREKEAKWWVLGSCDTEVEGARRNQQRDREGAWEWHGSLEGKWCFCHFGVESSTVWNDW